MTAQPYFVFQLCFDPQQTVPHCCVAKVCVLADTRRHGFLGEAEFYTSLQLIFLARKDLAAADQAYIRDWLVREHGCFARQ